MLLGLSRGGWMERPKKVLLGYDGLPGSDLVLGFTWRMVKRLGGSLTVVHVVEEETVVQVGNALKLDDAAAREYCIGRKRSVFGRALAICEDTEDCAPPVETELVFAASVIDGLVGKAREISADIIVVQPTPQRRDMRAEIVHRLMRSSSLPVLVVQGDNQTRDDESESTVIVPLDDALRTVESSCVGLCLAGALGAKVLLTHVVRSGESSVLEELPSEVKRCLSEAKKVAEKHGAEHETIVIDGEAPDLALMRLAIVRRASMLLMRRSRRTLMGSATDLLIRNSKQNILVVNELACSECDDCPLMRDEGGEA